MKQIFLEAAIDSPHMFADGYTHYSKEKGFQKLDPIREFDDLVWCVQLIDAKETKSDSRNWNMPHPKWYEFRKRIDKATNNNDTLEWKVSDVLVEATRKLHLPEYLRGKHYKRGLGFVHSCQV